MGFPNSPGVSRLLHVPPRGGRGRDRGPVDRGQRGALRGQCPSLGARGDFRLESTGFHEVRGAKGGHLRRRNSVFFFRESGVEDKNRWQAGVDDSGDAIYLAYPYLGGFEGQTEG